MHMRCYGLRAKRRRISSGDCCTEPKRGRQLHHLVVLAIGSDRTGRNPEYASVSPVIGRWEPLGMEALESWQKTEAEQFAES